MFSEYASRFLQQSPHRLPDQSRPTSRNPLDRRRYTPPVSPYRQRNLHPASSIHPSRFPFARRKEEQDAPLFHSTMHRFPDDEETTTEEEQHERDVADAYALQKSRQAFGRSHLTESTESEEREYESSRIGQGQDHEREEGREDRGRGGSAFPLAFAGKRDLSLPESEASTAMSSTKGKGRLVDVNLASTINEDDPPESLARLSPTNTDMEDPPPHVRPIRPPAGRKADLRRSSYLPPDPDEEEAHIGLQPRGISPDRESVPAPTVILPALEPPKHDAFWATLFHISSFALLATFVLIWFHTSPPSSKKPLGDTVYSALRGSTSMLLWDTMIAILVALLWLALLRSYVRTLVFTLLIAVPLVLFAFTLYPLINSFRGRYHGDSYQDKVMRCFSFVPAIVAGIWTYQVILSRHSLSRAINILEFSTNLLAASPHLVTLGFATLGVVVGWTWGWMLMFERIFLSGHFTGSSSNTAARWVVDANSWWLGAFFILQYLWTLGVIAGMQRTATAATVSQWYFHRTAVPRLSSQEVVRASLQHSSGTMLGTISLSSLLSLLLRLPLIFLPGRLAGLINLCAYWLIPSNLATLTNPLTLTYAAIHSQPLGIAARGMSQLAFIISRTNPSNTMGIRNFSPQSGSTVIPYRLAKLLLQATRWIMSFSLGLAGWVRTAHSLKLAGEAGVRGVRGSLYAYVVGLIAGTIGFAVLGAVENVVGAVVDATVVCWASETGGRSEGRFCREAGELFAEESEDGEVRRY